jgi:uncharacterized protein involved in outer membrane biogenesis
MRVFWRALAVIGGVVLLLLIAVAVAIRSVDINEFIGPLQQRVKEATGRDLSVRGGIDFKFGLEPRLVINDVSLGNASWGKQPQMITAKQLEAQIALLPLLRKRFEIVRFKLVEPKIALETDAKGNANWEFPDLSGTAPTGAAARAPSGGTLGALAVGDLAISDGSLTYRNGRTGETTFVVIDQLSVHARDAQSPISGSFRGKINDTPVALEGDFGPLDQVLRQRWPYPVAVQGNIGTQKASVRSQLSVQSDTISAAPLQAAYGTTQLTGQMSVTTGGPRPKFDFKLAAPTMTLAELAATGQANVKAAAQAAAPAHAKSRYVFGEEPIDVSGLHSFDASGDLAIDKLVLPDGQHLDHVHVQVALQDGRLSMPVQAGVLGGNLQARVQVDATRAPEAALVLNLDAKNLDLSGVLAAFGMKREVRGGKVDVRADISARGASPRQWASTASGSFLATSGQASLVNAKGGATESFDKLAEAVNPFRNVDATTELRCAVVRLPLRGGIASVDRSIALETDKLGATASGTVDFRNETFDLSVKPQIRQGIPINISQIAQLVRLHGPFTQPTVGVDAVAAASTVAKIAAGLSTGGAGLAALGGSLLEQPSGDTGAPCQVALGRASGSGPPGEKAPAKQQPVPTEEINKALGKLFGR